MASKCYLLINSYFSTSNPHSPSELSPSTGTRQLTSGGRRDSPLKRDGGASATWSSSPRPSPSPSPAAPELTPRPRDRRPSHRRCRSPLPPARAEPCPPPPRLVPSGLDTCSPHPCQEFREPPCPPPLPPPDGDNDADDRRSVDATTDPLPENNRLRATQSTSLLSPLPTTGGGRRTLHPVTPGITQMLCQVPPHGHPSLWSSLAGDRRGGSGGGGGCQARRQRRKRRQWHGDNDFFLLCVRCCVR